MEAMWNYNWHWEKNRPKHETQKWGFYDKMSSTANYASALIFMLTQESQANADTIVYVSTFIFDDIWDLFYFSFRHFSQETSYE